MNELYDAINIVIDNELDRESPDQQFLDKLNNRRPEEKDED